MIFYYAATKIIQCTQKDDPTITSTTKLIDRKSISVDLEGSGFEIIVSFQDKKYDKIVKLPYGIGSVVFVNI